MANRPANAGSGREMAPMGNAAPPVGGVTPPAFGTTPPPPVHHDAPRAAQPRAAEPRAAQPRASHRAAPSRGHRAARDRRGPVVSGLAWLPYLIVLAGAGAGMFVAWQGSRYAGRGAALVGCSLLAAGLARLILPPRYAALLSTRRKAADAATFAVFGAAVIAVALTLP
jgi:Protein of unknown function (DUF3017)